MCKVKTKITRRVMSKKPSGLSRHSPKKLVSLSRQPPKDPYAWERVKDGYIRDARDDEYEELTRELRDEILKELLEADARGEIKLSDYYDKD
jgi:hypothetical protein